jgi:hypothetical protein
LEDGLLGFEGASLGFPRTLFGVRNALLDLTQALPALLLLGFQLGEPLRLGRAAFRRFGPLLYLTQAFLGFLHRSFLGFARLLQPLLR